MLRYKNFLYIAAAALTVTACSSNHKLENKLDDKQGQYWQRVSSSSAIYNRGPKAQQMLHTDISRCIVELNEMAAVGAIREAVPADGIPPSGDPLDPKTPAGQLAHWDAPERDGDLRHEHLEYHDFETCMRYKGWERIAYVPFDVQKRSKDVYYETITGQKRRSKAFLNEMPATQDKGEYSQLND